MLVNALHVVCQSFGWLAFARAPSSLAVESRSEFYLYSLAPVIQIDLRRI
jgi:hypothetical protein